MVETPSAGAVRAIPPVERWHDQQAHPDQVRARAEQEHRRRQSDRIDRRAARGHPERLRPTGMAENLLNMRRAGRPGGAGGEWSPASG